MLEFNTNEFEDTRQVDALKVIWMYTFPLKTLFIPQIEITGLSSKSVYGEAFLSLMPSWAAAVVAKGA